MNHRLQYNYLCFQSFHNQYMLHHMNKLHKEHYLLYSLQHYQYRYKCKFYHQ
uniref:Uncharacterized protein n=1 Tax=Siphoviridae sp. cteZR38 TaxID=2827906 RepID=A0A8S5SN30_9CAUD|nr:MAG TPA: hypothetical protein [Siphoviridae sp. cteZR38]